MEFICEAFGARESDMEKKQTTTTEMSLAFCAEHEVLIHTLRHPTVTVP